VAERQPEAQPPTDEELAAWRDVCDARLGVEVGIAMLAAERATESQIVGLRTLAGEMTDLVDDFPAYRAADVRFHVGLARSTGSVRLEQALTEAQGEMSDLIAHIAHPPSVLRSSNKQHAAIVAAVEARDATAAAACMAAHLQGTEHVLAGLLP
jgi:DNA-binding FadR family transcriptional regulator